MTLDVPKLRTSGTYSLTGKVLNIEGLDSHGPYRNEYSDITATGRGTIRPKGKTGIEIGEMDIRLQIRNINVHMECLFPRRNRNCCDKDKEFRSCNPILSKTIHRTINTKTSGSSIVERFQEEITDKVAVIVKQYLNKAISKVDSGFIF